MSGWASWDFCLLNKFRQLALQSALELFCSDLFSFAVFQCRCTFQLTHTYEIYWIRFNAFAFYAKTIAEKQTDASKKEKRIWCKVNGLENNVFANREYSLFDGIRRYASCVQNFRCRRAYLPSFSFYPIRQHASQSTFQKCNAFMCTTTPQHTQSVSFFFVCSSCDVKWYLKPGINMSCSWAQNKSSRQWEKTQRQRRVKTKKITVRTTTISTTTSSHSSVEYKLNAVCIQYNEYRVRTKCFAWFRKMFYAFLGILFSIHRRGQDEYALALHWAWIFMLPENSASAALF